MKDFWPEDITVDVSNTPISIMREQAELLGHKTRNLVEAAVGIGTPQDDKFVYYFYIVAPTLNNYHFLLFTVKHKIEMYPVTIYLDEILGAELRVTPSVKQNTADTTMATIIQSIAPQPITSSPQHILTLSIEEELVQALQRILSSQRSLQVIRSLLSIVNTTHEPVPA